MGWWATFMARRKCSHDWVLERKNEGMSVRGDSAMGGVAEPFFIYHYRCKLCGATMRETDKS